MEDLILGLHHVALKCDSVERFEKALDFYTNVLGLSVLRRWGEGDRSGAMVSTGNSILEITARGQLSDQTGSINHISLATKDVDRCIELCRAYGCTITLEPKELVIPSDPPYPARFGFAVGPVGEKIEFFCEH